MNANTPAPSRIKRVAKSKWSWATVLLVAALTLYVISRISAAISSIEYGLTPPDLPKYRQAEATKYINPTGWPKTGSEWFHHAPQGTATIPVPYQWLIALEEPKSNPWFVFVGKKGPFIGEYMLRLGFIGQEASEWNPDALPIGIARTESIYFPGIDHKASAAGFTCAACHTGQITYGGNRFVVDGGPAMFDLGQLTRSLGAALGQTALSSKFSIFDGRFERFARKVLGSNDNVLTRKRLREDLSNTIAHLIKTSDAIVVTEGFTRLDALNRIGNAVFDSAMNRPANYSPIDAPVNYPHIWTTSWFDWVQYDGSIMQPLTRNAGEALGVEAYVDMTGPKDQRFASSVDIRNLVKIEDWLGGTHPSAQNRFNGLLAPDWPAEFPPVDEKLAAEGAQLYGKMCEGCHLPPVESQAFWTPKYWRKIEYIRDGERRETQESYIKLKIIGVDKIGTDPAQAGVLVNRTIDTTGLNLDTEVCTWAEISYGGKSEPWLTFLPVNDSATSNFGLALGAVVERTMEQWFKQNYIPEAKWAVYEGSRPNCLQADEGYKARPLNGVWATAPFLHNGSVATIYDLLSPLADRPTFVQLGSQAFDAKHLGIEQGEAARALNRKYRDTATEFTPDYVDGLFVLDTRLAGNRNTGHIFDDRDDEAYQGRIGRKLSEDEKFALIEYLKTL